jgi:hypothetical protein
MRPILLSVLLLTTLPTHAQETGKAAARIDRQSRPTPKSHVIGHVLCNDTRQPGRGATVMLQGIPPESAKPTPNQPPPQGQTFFSRVSLDGTYSIAKVPAGDYAVIAFLPGYLSPLDDVEISESEPDFDKQIRDKLAASGILHVPDDGTLTADVVLERGAAISGRVLFADGAPASQVNIELQNTQAKPVKPSGQSFNFASLFRTAFTHQSLSTDDQGRFRVAGIRPGAYRVAAVEPVSLEEINGGSAGDGMGAAMSIGAFGGISNPNSLRFFAGDTLHKKDARTYELRAGDTITDIEIRLPISGLHPLRVRLSAHDGRPISDAELTLTDTADEAIRFTASVNSLSNPMAAREGIFEFHQVPPGTYTLLAEHAMIVPPMPPEGTNPPELIEGTHPTSAFADSTTTVLIKDSDPADINLTLDEIPLPKPQKPGAP